MEQNSRRSFIKALFSGALIAPLAGEYLSPSGEKEANRVKKGSMYYRRLGRTNLFISEISLGGSPIPDWAILLQAIERGVNYIDTSHSYMNGNSERQIGRLLKEVGRDRVCVGTKFHLRNPWSTESIIESVNSSLDRLKTDYLDVLLIHGAENPDHLTDEKVLSAFETLKKEGKFKYRGLSCHSNHLEVIKEAIRCGLYDMIQVGYNVFDIQETEMNIKTYDDYLGSSGIRELLRRAKSKDVGIIAMKTLKVGGKRQNTDKYRTRTTSIFQAMLKWALENQNIASVVTEILTFQQLEEDLGVVGQPLIDKERKMLFAYVAENSQDYCHMCGICEKSCPQKIKISSILRYLAYFQDYSKPTRAKKAYSRLRPEQTSQVCKNCALCERHCPYGVSVRERIREADFLLHFS
jgi:predicted aldo/keto reductase-like oxidoreductase